MTQYKCITTLVEHILTDSARLFKGTEFENTWKFYHDALSLMTSKSTIQWTKNNNYLKRWVLPLGINKGTVYFGRVIGNSPELMLMDNSLNKDLDDEVCYHIALMYNLEHDDLKKFTLSTPKRG